MKQILVFLLGIVLLFPQPVLAYEAEDPTQQILQETLEQAAELHVPDFDFTQTVQKVYDGSLNMQFDSVLQYVFHLLFKEIKAHIGLLIQILVLAVLAGVLCNLQQSLPGDGVAEISFLACFSIIGGLSVTIVSDLTQLAVTTIDNLMLLIAGIMPIMNTLIVSAKAATFAGFYPGLFVAMQGFVTICKNLFLPLVMVIMSLSVINALSGRFHTTRLIDLARQIIKWGLGLLLTVFVGILSVHSFTANITGIAGRTVKYALCNFIPMVGGVLAESAEAVVSSVRVIRSSFGITGMLAVLSICCLPLIKILATSILYRFAAGVAEPATDKRIVQLLMDLAGTITLVFVIVLMVSVMFIISLALLCALTI